MNTISQAAINTQMDIIQFFSLALSPKIMNLHFDIFNVKRFSENHLGKLRRSELS